MSDNITLSEDVRREVEKLITLFDTLTLNEYMPHIGGYAYMAAIYDTLTLGETNRLIMLGRGVIRFLEKHGTVSTNTTRSTVGHHRRGGSISS